MRYHITSIIFFLILFLIGCDSTIDYVQLKLPKKNPTSYEFNASIDKIHAVLNQDIRWIGKVVKYLSDTGRIWPLYAGILREPENSEDAIILSMGFDTSRIYYSRERIIPYWYHLHLHFTRIDENITRVEVRTIIPRIGIGVKFPSNVLPFSTPGSALTVDVEPSTIEEYELLLKIGEALGMKDRMEPLVLPNPPLER